MTDIVTDLYDAINGAHRSVVQDHELMRRAAREIKKLREDRIETEARKMCFGRCSKGEFLDFENGCCSVCKTPSECQSWRAFSSDARSALGANASNHPHSAPDGEDLSHTPTL